MGAARVVFADRVVTLRAGAHSARIFRLFLEETNAICAGNVNSEPTIFRERATHHHRDGFSAGRIAVEQFPALY